MSPDVFWLVLCDLPSEMVSVSAPSELMLKFSCIEMTPRGRSFKQCQAMGSAATRLGLFLCALSLLSHPSLCGHQENPWQR